jgi:16S rRNA processing protein RimM
MEKQPINSFQEASNQVCLGVVTGPHGIRGAVKIKTFTVNPKDITTYGPLRDEKGVVYRLKVISQPGPDLVVVHIDGVKDRNQAELLRGCRLFVERNALPTTNDDEFYYSDLIGLAVRTTEGNDIGVITSVNNYGAGDFLEAQAQDGQVFTIPFRKEAVIGVDLSSRQVTVSAEFVLSTK